MATSPHFLVGGRVLDSLTLWRRPRMPREVARDMASCRIRTGGGPTRGLGLRRRIRVKVILLAWGLKSVSKIAKKSNLSQNTVVTSS